MQLIKSIARRVSDGRMLRLIKWLEMQEDDGKLEPRAPGAEVRKEPRSLHMRQLRAGLCPALPCGDRQLLSRQGTGSRDADGGQADHVIRNERKTRCLRCPEWTQLSHLGCTGLFGESGSTVELGSTIASQFQHGFPKTHGSPTLLDHFRGRGHPPDGIERVCFRRTTKGHCGRSLSCNLVYPFPKGAGRLSEKSPAGYPPPHHRDIHASLGLPLSFPAMLQLAWARPKQSRRRCRFDSGWRRWPKLRFVRAGRRSRVGLSPMTS